MSCHQNDGIARRRAADRLPRPLPEVHGRAPGPSSTWPSGSTTASPGACRGTRSRRSSREMTGHPGLHLRSSRRTFRSGTKLARRRGTASRCRTRSTGDVERGKEVFTTKSRSLPWGRTARARPPTPALWGPKSYSIGASMARERTGGELHRAQHALQTGPARSPRRRPSTSRLHQLASAAGLPRQGKGLPDRRRRRYTPYDTFGHEAFRPPLGLPRTNPSGRAGARSAGDQPGDGGRRPDHDRPLERPDGVTSRPLSRRDLLSGAAGPSVARCPRGGWPRPTGNRRRQRGRRSRGPDEAAGRAHHGSGRRSAVRRPRADADRRRSGNSLTPLQDLTGNITPADLHFERHHAGIPTIDPARHTLTIHGLVERPLSFSVEDLQRLPPGDAHALHRVLGQRAHLLSRAEARHDAAEGGRPRQHIRVDRRAAGHAVPRGRRRSRRRSGSWPRAAMRAC